MVFRLASVLLNALATALASVAVLEQCDPVTRLVTSLLFAVHPIKTEAVDGSVGLAEILSALLSFAAFFAARRRQPLASVLLCFLASLAKETGVTSALVLAVYYYQSQKNVRDAVLVPGSAIALFYAVRLLVFGRHTATISPSIQDNPMIAQRGLLWLVNIVVVQAKYVQLVVIPWTLMMDYANGLQLATSLAELQVQTAAQYSVWLV